MKTSFAELIGWYGTAAILVAYALVSFGVIPAGGLLYQLLNLSGAIGIIIISVRKKVRQTVVLNIFWGLIAMIALIGVLLHA